MGGAWAYEALSFAGYWAWDPVENTSLVPWLTLVAGIHTNLIARSTGYSIRSTYGFYLLTFLLILYSTYLTRSGILGDTSVHSFTEMGLGFQLIIFIASFVAAGFGPLGGALPGSARSVAGKKRATAANFGCSSGRWCCCFRQC
jgi:Cytochrome c biogenesis factor